MLGDYGWTFRAGALVSSAICTSSSAQLWMRLITRSMARQNQHDGGDAGGGRCGYTLPA